MKRALRPTAETLATRIEELERKSGGDFVVIPADVDSLGDEPLTAEQVEASRAYCRGQLREYAKRKDRLYIAIPNAFWRV